VSFGREARHIADRTDDPRGQDGSYAEDLGEDGARGFYLGFDAPVEVGDLPVQRPDSKRSTSEANRRRRRVEAPPFGRMERRMRAALSAESFPATPPGRRSRRSACRRLSARVRSATRSSRLSESRRSASEAASYSTAASRPLREAAKAVARASRSSFLRELPVESTRTRAESFGGTSTTNSPEAANLPARCLPRGHRRSPPPNGARGTVSPSVRGTSDRRGSAGRTHARGAHPWLRRPPLRRPTPCGDRPLLAPS
jgi:hypothetical protein